MLEGQTLGPFKVEKELGAGAMGAVYRGVYTKTGQHVAIKIMAPALVSNAQSAARFEREADILKQLRHPNIVRLFGVGKERGMRYYAMEYIEGESMDKILARRGVIPWEEVVTLGTQLCSALQHAHDKGVVHRDLKPSNLMILADGTLKLTDFGIAKDLDSTALTSANCTVGTAAYMSPEQCRGDRNLTSKSDVYSLGVVLYELLTGKKPFDAETAMEMFMAHVNEPAPRPSREVMDLPVWMDTLICQMMEKDPEKRPLNAAKVAEALEEVREKFEAQQSAGVEAAGKRRVDRRASDRPADEKDREAARALRGKKKRKTKSKAFYERIWFQAAGLIVILSGLIITLYIVFSPASADKVFNEAKALMESSNPDDWFKARTGPIQTYLNHHADDGGEQAKQVQEWARKVDLYEADQLLVKYMRNKGKPIETQAQNDAEKAGFRAIEVEAGGDLKGAREVWEQIKTDFAPGKGHSHWGRLAEHRLEMYDAIAAQEERWKPLLDHIRRFGTEPSGLDQQEARAFLAWRAEKFGDPYLARKHYLELKKETEEKIDNTLDIHQRRYWHLFASAHAHALRDVEEPEDRLAELARGIDMVLDLTERNYNLETPANVIALYADEPELKDQVERARSLLRRRP
jgi:serine/threonine-protein kinase